MHRLHTTMFTHTRNKDEALAMGCCTKDSYPFSQQQRVEHFIGVDSVRYEKKCRHNNLA